MRSALSGFANRADALSAGRTQKHPERKQDIIEVRISEQFCAEPPCPAPCFFPMTLRIRQEVRSAVNAEGRGPSMANMLDWLIKRHCEAENLGWPHAEGASKGSKTQAASSRQCE
jgi:hypothetical protein